MNQFHFWLPRIIYINQSKIARQKHWPSPGGTSESWFSIKENAFTLFLPIPCSTTKAAIHLFKKTGQNKENKERNKREGKKLRQREWRKRKQRRKGNEKRVSKTFSHVMKKNDGEEKKKVREAGGATGRRGGKEKKKK